MSLLTATTPQAASHGALLRCAVLQWLPTVCCAAATIGTPILLFHIPHAFAGFGFTWDPKVTFAVVCGVGLVVCVAVAAAAYRMQQTEGYQAVQRAPAQMYDLLGLVRAKIAGWCAACACLSGCAPDCTCKLHALWNQWAPLCTSRLFRFLPGPSVPDSGQ